MEDDDFDPRSWEDLAFHASRLREGNKRQRLRGQLGAAMRELAELEVEIKARKGSAEDRVRIDQQLWQLNETLGGGKFPWRPNRRPKGASDLLKAELDDKLIQRALALMAPQDITNITAEKSTTLENTAEATAPQQFGASVKRVSGPGLSPAEAIRNVVESAKGELHKHCVQASHEKRLLRKLKKTLKRFPLPS
jgi:hypothetical protein